jgi:hypothetical protein
MRWLSPLDRKVNRILKQKEWHEYFAWWPVKLTSSEMGTVETVWLEKIYRRVRWPNEYEIRTSMNDLIYYERERAKDRDVVRHFLKKKKKFNQYEYVELTDLIIEASKNK